MAQLLHLESEDRDRDINVNVNSPGGSITAPLAIYNTMPLVKPDVSTYGMGQARSTAAVLLAAGAAGKVAQVSCRRWPAGRVGDSAGTSRPTLVVGTSGGASVGPGKIRSG